MIEKKKMKKCLQTNSSWGGPRGREGAEKPAGFTYEHLSSPESITWPRWNRFSAHQLVVTAAGCHESVTAYLQIHFSSTHLPCSILINTRLPPVATFILLPATQREPHFSDKHGVFSRDRFISVKKFVKLTTTLCHHHISASTTSKGGPD